MKGKAVLGGAGSDGDSRAVRDGGAGRRSGGSPTLLTWFFVCHGSTAGPAGRLRCPSPLSSAPRPGGPILQRVKLGKAALACAFAGCSRNATPHPELRIARADLRTWHGRTNDVLPHSTTQKPRKVRSPSRTVFDALVGTGLSVPVPSTQVSLRTRGFFQRSERSPGLRRAQPFRPPAPGASLGRRNSGISCGVEERVSRGALGTVPRLWRVR